MSDRFPSDYIFKFSSLIGVWYSQLYWSKWTAAARNRLIRYCHIIRKEFYDDFSVYFILEQWRRYRDGVQRGTFESLNSGDPLGRTLWSANSAGDAKLSRTRRGDQKN